MLVDVLYVSNNWTPPAAHNPQTKVEQTYVKVNLTNSKPLIQASLVVAIKMIR
jgi:hypothetical protein